MISEKQNTVLMDKKHTARKKNFVLAFITVTACLHSNRARLDTRLSRVGQTSIVVNTYLKYNYATAKKPARHIADDRSPWAVMPCKAWLVGPFEFGKVVLDGAIEGRSLGPARAIDCQFGCTAH